MEIDRDNLHHAYLVLGDRSGTEYFISELFNNLNIKKTGNPDVIFWREEKFGIDEARILKSRAETKAFGERKIFVITSSQITPEAQNALLKVFEEPPANTHFFVLAKRNNLIPTLLSRLSLIRLPTEITKKEEAYKFLKLDIAGRLSYIKSKGMDEGFLLADFLEELIRVLKNSHSPIGNVKNVFNLIKFSNDPAVNTRMILEHLALTLPLSIE